MSRKIVIIFGTRPIFFKITKFGKEFARYKSKLDYKLVQIAFCWEYHD